jgi:hypothetical protein
MNHPPSDGSVKIFLGIPTYDGQMCGGAVYPIVVAASEYQIHLMVNSSSLLPQNFNMLWCAFVESDCDYFVMLHSDIQPDVEFVKKLVDRSKDFDVVSAVSPIKDDSGDTSTAMFQGDTIRRLSMKDIDSLPETFTTKDVHERLGLEGKLVLNTGCWIAKRGDWCEKFPGFSTSCMIKEGKPISLTEDWRFSLWAYDQGLKLAATQIPLTHYGTKGWDA